MIRTLTIASLFAACAAPAFAAEPTTPSNDATFTKVHAQELKNDYDAKQAHNILASRGFFNISALDRDDDGRWVGTAMKDGKTIFVGVVLPHGPAPSATN